MDKVRKNIFEALESLSSTVDWSSDFLDLYDTDDTLVTKAEELYLALLEGIEGMMVRPVLTSFLLCTPNLTSILPLKGMVRS